LTLTVHTKDSRHSQEQQPLIINPCALHPLFLFSGTLSMYTPRMRITLL